MTQSYDERIWKMAQKRVAFRRHLLVYILVNIALIVIWYVSRDATKEKTAMTYWFLYPLCGWGIGVALHFWNAYHDDDSLIDKEYNKLKGRMESRMNAKEENNSDQKSDVPNS